MEFCFSCIKVLVMGITQFLNLELHDATCVTIKHDIRIFTPQSMLPWSRDTYLALLLLSNEKKYSLWITLKQLHTNLLQILLE